MYIRPMRQLGKFAIRRVLGEGASGIVYLALVWSLSAAIRVLEGRLALPESR